MRIDIGQYKDLLDSIDGVNEKELKMIKEISSYNRNYYTFKAGFKHYTLLGESNDEDETEWWWCIGNAKLLVGYSYTQNENIKVVKNINY